MSNRHPRRVPSGRESPARAAQLERIKAERRRKHSMGRARGHYFRRSPDAEPAKTVTLRDVVAELQRISMGGVMCSPAVYDLARPATWPDADACCELFETTWRDLAEMAGLQLARATRERFG